MITAGTKTESLEVPTRYIDSLELELKWKCGVRVPHHLYSFQLP